MIGEYLSGGRGVPGSEPLAAMAWGGGWGLKSTIDREAKDGGAARLDGAVAGWPALPALPRCRRA